MPSMNSNRMSSLLLVMLLSTLVCQAAFSQSVGKWRRAVISLSNPTYSGNPFELEADATFTHAGSGTTITLPAYYAGSNTWKFGFMPTRTGTWNWTTSSSDPDLNGKTGSLQAVSSGLPGLLKRDSTHARKWRFSDGDYVVPISLRMEFFSEPASSGEFAAAADFLKNGVKGHMYETRLTEEYGQFGGRTDFIFAGDWRNHQFDLTNWDRMEERMEALAARGVGAHIMFYGDDAGTPGWSAQSATEALVIRYVVARLAGYPVVVFNSGIDIGEFRSDSDIEWWGDRVRALDPYDHPVSSREHSSNVNYSGETFVSRAFPNQSFIAPMIDAFNSASVPVSFDDAWGENRGSHAEKDHRPADIRRAFWKATAAGGVGGLIRGGGDGLSRTGFYSIKQVSSDLESEQWLSLINPFISQRLGTTFGSMVPAPSLVNGNEVYAIADPARSKILVVALGANDRYDGGGGGGFSVNLSGVSGSRTATWFDPRSGAESAAGNLAGGNSHALNPPSNDDWVLLIDSGAGGDDSTPPASPGNVIVE